MVGLSNREVPLLTIVPNQLIPIRQLTYRNEVDILSIFVRNEMDERFHFLEGGSIIS